MTREPGSRVIVGCERTLVVAEHLASLAAPEREDVRDGNSPIAIWARGHSLALAQRRSKLNWRDSHNRKRTDRRDDAPPLIDEVTT
jgi:hypothetical protein